MLPALFREFVLPSWGKLSPSEILCKPDNTLVTDVDISLQDMLQRHLQELLPGCTLLGEETRPEHQRPNLISCEWTWVIDPLDGTENFVRHLPHFGTIIGLMHMGKPYAGWIYLPFGLDGAPLLLSGVLGQTPTANGVALTQQPPTAGKPRIIFSHFLHLCAGDQEFPGFTIVPTDHCAALHFAKILTGQCDGFAHLHATPWDGLIAAWPMLDFFGGKIAKTPDGRAPAGHDLYDQSQPLLALRRAEEWDQVAPAVFSLAKA